MEINLAQWTCLRAWVECWIPASSSQKAAGDGPSARVSATHVGNSKNDLCIPGFGPGPALAVKGIWGNEPVTKICFLFLWP